MFKGLEGKRYDDMTMEIHNYYDPFYMRRLERSKKRQKAAQRRATIARVARYTITIAILVAAYIIVTGWF